MGCGASSAKGRDTHSSVAREAESFFPPPAGTNTGKVIISGGPPTGSQQHHNNNNLAKESAAALSTGNNNSRSLDTPSSPSINKKKTTKSSTSSSSSVPTPLHHTPSPTKKNKKKATYVPPSPITATVAVQPPPPPPLPIAAETKTTKATPLSLSGEEEPSLEFGANDSNQQQQQQKTGEDSFDPDDFLGGSLPQPKAAAAEEEGSANFDEFDGDDEFDSDDLNDFQGILDLQTADFDQAAISVITGMTTRSEESATRSTSAASEIQYPKDQPMPNSGSGMRFDEIYRLKGVLGTGAFSTVREGFHRTSSKVSYAVKCINRKKLSEEDEAALLDEVSILKEMRHPHIIRLFDFFEESSTYYLVMERMRGGELFDRIVAKAYYNEKEARDTCKIILEAVRYCHKNHVAHRDLKPENLLLLSDVDDSAVKIADFGFAKKVYEPNSLTTQCGTPGYVAPEILEGTAYDERADMWSVGVILYILLGGYPPFIESTQRDLFRKIRKGDYEFHEEYWGTVSGEAKELISSLLTVSCKDRLTADDALENEWIMGDDAKLESRDLGGNLEKLRNFNAKRKFRAAVSTIMAVNKLNMMGKEFFTSKSWKEGES